MNLASPPEGADLIEIAVIPAGYERVKRLIESDGGLLLVRYPGDLATREEDGIRTAAYFVIPREVR